MYWQEEDANSNPRKNGLHRSVSSFDLNFENFTNGIKESKSFTGALDELKTVDDKQITMQEHDPNYYMKMLSDNPTGIKEFEYITKEISTDKLFVVNNEMLNYRGKQYELNDIATRWKKDCRMWLWKGFKNRKNRSVVDVRERMQSLRLNTSTDTIQKKM